MSLPLGAHVPNLKSEANNLYLGGGGIKNLQVRIPVGILGPAKMQSILSE